MELNRRSDHGGYLKIGDWTIYVEVSDATEGNPHIDAWKKDWPEDCVMNLKPVWEFSDCVRSA